jgi:hypothetical protein
MDRREWLMSRVQCPIVAQANLLGITMTSRITRQIPDTFTGIEGSEAKSNIDKNSFTRLVSTSNEFLKQGI